LHMATLRNAAAERAVLRNESRAFKQKAPTPYPVKSLENRYAALRRRSVYAPYDLIRKLMEDENWRQDMATLRQSATEPALLRNESAKLEKRKVQAPIQEVVKSLTDPQSAARTMSVQALSDLNPDRAASLLNIALREGSPQQRREIGATLAASGVVDEAIN